MLIRGHKAVPRLKEGCAAAVLEGQEYCSVVRKS